MNIEGGCDIKWAILERITSQMLCKVKGIYNCIYLINYFKIKTKNTCGINI